MDVHNIWVRPIEEHEQEIGTVLYPEDDLAEYIVTFPADAGLPPLYLVFIEDARFLKLFVFTYRQLLSITPTHWQDEINQYGKEWIHRPHDALINPGCETAMDSLVNAVTKEGNQLKRVVFDNEV